MKVKLIRYGQTPQVTGLEYKEIMDLQEHPEKEAHYAKIVKARLRAAKLDAKQENA